MSFSVFMSTAYSATFTYSAGVWTFSVNLRDMIPPERLNKPYKMRLSLNSAPFALDDGAPYHASIELTNAIINTQYNGSLNPMFLLDTVAAVTGVAGSRRFVVRPDDNMPVIVKALGEVYTIKIKPQRNFAPMTFPTLGFHFILHFEPVDE